MKSVIVDVRTAAEFAEGHVEGSINIPLSQLAERAEDLRKMKDRIVLCCASGNRSGQAESFLKGNGIDCINVGSWRQAQSFIKS